MKYKICYNNVIKLPRVNDFSSLFYCSYCTNYITLFIPNMREIKFKYIYNLIMKFYSQCNLILLIETLIDK